MKAAPRFLVSGYYGFGNAGDEAILGGLLEGFRQVMPEAELTVSSGNPAETISEHGVLAVPRGLGSVRKRLRLSDVLISGGGGLLQDVTSWRSPLYYLAVVQLAVLARRPVAFVGQSIGPLKRHWVRSLVRRGLSTVGAIAVRDELSRETIERLGLSSGVETTADLAFILPRPTEAEIAAARSKAGVAKVSDPLAAVSLRRLPGGNEDGRVLQAAAIIGRACGEIGLRPLLIPLQSPRDFDLAQAAAAEMATSSAIVAPPLRAREILALMASCRLVIAMRLHALIFAALCTVPLVALSYDPKVDGLMEHLGLAPAMSMDRLDADQLRRAIVDVWGNRDELREALVARAANLRLRALRNVEIAVSLLPRGR